MDQTTQETVEITQAPAEGPVLYECGICDCLHPWNFTGDCRDDANRYADAEDYAERNHLSVFAITVFSWEDRLYHDEMAALV